MSTPFVVTRLTKTNAAAPSEWEGLTKDSRGIYARYSGGELSIYLGDPEDGPELAEANGRLILLKVVDLDNASAADMDLGTLKSHTNGFIDWPTREESDRDGV